MDVSQLEMDYRIEEHAELLTPSLVYYKEGIERNFDAILELAGNCQRLWPHVKSHKSSEMVKYQMKRGVTKFKCATIMEAKMLADLRAESILMAYPLVGPNQDRFLNLIESYPASSFWMIGDHFESLVAFSEKAKSRCLIVNTLLDINVGENRTGITFDRLFDMYSMCQGLEGLQLDGLHCYDGTRFLLNESERADQVRAINAQVQEARQRIEANGMTCRNVVLGGTPSFPFHAAMTEDYLSPGSAFLFDWGSKRKYPYLRMTYAALLLSRVISRPSPNTFTLDLGYKAIASDPTDQRGEILNLTKARPLFQNEEHWVWELPDEVLDEMPLVGDLMYVVPTHICPTSALYKEVLIVENKKITATWPVTARDR